ncbi:MAG TPA: YceI family protein [Sphingobium sp.]
MKRILVIAALAASLSIPAAVIAQSNPDAQAVQAGNYTIDSAHTLAQFSVNHFGINDFFGTLPGATGTLSIDPKALATAKLDVSVPVATLSTTNKVLDGELVSADWLDAGKYPAIRFVSTKVTRTGKNTATIAGNLTLHGVTKPATLNATFQAAAVNPMKKVYTLGFKATGTINRSDFGVSKYVPMVSDATQLTITAAFEKTAG